MVPCRCCYPLPMLPRLMVLNEKKSIFRRIWKLVYFSANNRGEQVQAYHKRYSWNMNKRQWQATRLFILENKQPPSISPMNKKNYKSHTHTQMHHGSYTYSFLCEQFFMAVVYWKKENTLVREQLAGIQMIPYCVVQTAQFI